MLHTAAIPTFTIRITRRLGCASDQGTVEIVAQPSTKEREITIQRQSYQTCLKCGQEAGHHLEDCPELLKVPAYAETT